MGVPVAVVPMAAVLLVGMAVDAEVTWVAEVKAAVDSEAAAKVMEAMGVRKVVAVLVAVEVALRVVEMEAVGTAEEETVEGEPVAEAMEEEAMEVVDLVVEAMGAEAAAVGMRVAARVVAL